MGVPCPVNYNPADYFVQLLAISPSKEQECRSTIERICNAFAESSVAEDINSIASQSATEEEVALKRFSKKKLRYLILH